MDCAMIKSVSTVPVSSITVLRVCIGEGWTHQVLTNSCLGKECGQAPSSHHSPLLFIPLNPELHPTPASFTQPTLLHSTFSFHPVSLKTSNSTSNHHKSFSSFQTWFPSSSYYLTSSVLCRPSFSYLPSPGSTPIVHNRQPAPSPHIQLFLSLYT